ncbi:MAG: N-6 DNA methylase, partial [Magnetococcales bacterium]|nr:N-6 DNA methylase [Magnetococcales bacterium]
TRRFERLLRETRVTIGLLVNGISFRLLYAPRGENSGTLTFKVSDMEQVGGRPILAAFHMLFKRTRMFSGPREERFPALLTKSREFQGDVSTRLSGQVLAALYELVRGFQAADERSGGNLLREVLEKNPDDIYGGLLNVLLRLVFLLYSEDRGLMPGGSLYVQNYSVHGLFERLRGDAQTYPDTMDHRYGGWAQLLALFRAVHGGCRHPNLTMPVRQGYLFEPERFPFLEGRGLPDGRLPLVADGVIQRVLDKLLILDGERLSYRTLDVEQIGSVYETMMGFRLVITTGLTVALKSTKKRGASVAVDLDQLLAIKPEERIKHLQEQADQKLETKAATAIKTAKRVDDLLVALERRIDRDATPHPLARESMVLQPTDERRRSGSHYTPRSLTEPMVQRTLGPVLAQLGDNPTPERILDLKVLDPAVGSGAFLVAACRELGDALVRAWHFHGCVPRIPPDEDEILLARRLVAQRCLYGVDRNPMAADLAKLSLWLATLARDHPFTFLDHAIRCGDSLVGLTQRQIEDFHWKPMPALAVGQEIVAQRLRAATASRKEILDAGDDMAPALKRQKLTLADNALHLVRLTGDLVIAAFFAADKDKERENQRNALLDQFLRHLREADFLNAPDKTADALRQGAHPVLPFHWEIEFPEVFLTAQPGFDAIIGNPPFAGKNTLLNGNREGYLPWLQALHEESHGNADLVAHFFRRAFNLLREGGCFGLIATNTIGQGDTRSTGLRWICTHDGTLYWARRRFKWPGEAAVVVSLVHGIKGEWSGSYELDGRSVERITAFLFHDGGHDNPAVLKANADKSFIESYVLGMGFTFDDTDTKGVASPLAEMHRLIEQDPRNAERIFPYIGGEEVNDSPTHAHHRYVINFGEMSEAEARQWPELMRIIEERVKPDRQKLNEATPDGKRRKERWWLWGRYTPALFNALRKVEWAIVNSQVSTHLCFTLKEKSSIFAHYLNIIIGKTSMFCVLQSKPHEVWARFFGSSLGDGLRYTPSDCFETFPFPKGFENHPNLEAAGQAYYAFRADLMIRHNEGLTKTYNRFHDPEETSPDIQRLRELHAAMDRAVLDAYGWNDIDTHCDFILDWEDEEETTSRRKKPWRLRWPDPIRDEVLARLLALNTKRAKEENLIGLASSASGKPMTKRGRKPAMSGPGMFGDEFL